MNGRRRARPRVTLTTGDSTKRATKKSQVTGKPKTKTKPKKVVNLSGLELRSIEDFHRELNLSSTLSTSFKKGNFKACKAPGIDFSQVAKSFNGADFTGADLTGASFTSTNLHKIDFTETNLSAA